MKHILFFCVFFAFISAYQSLECVSLPFNQDLTDVYLDDLEASGCDSIFSLIIDGDYNINFSTLEHRLRNIITVTHTLTVRDTSFWPLENLESADSLVLSNYQAEEFFNDRITFLGTFSVFRGNLKRALLTAVVDSRFGTSIKLQETNLLESVSLPNVPTIRSLIITDNVKLFDVDLLGATSINSVDIFNNPAWKELYGLANLESPFRHTKINFSPDCSNSCNLKILKTLSNATLIEPNVNTCEIPENIDEICSNDELRVCKIGDSCFGPGLTCPECTITDLVYCNDVLSTIIDVSEPFITCFNVLEFEKGFTAEYVANDQENIIREGDIVVSWNGGNQQSDVLSFDMSSDNSQFFLPGIGDFPGRLFEFEACLDFGNVRECVAKSKLRRTFIGSISGSIQSQFGSSGVSGIHIVLSHPDFEISYPSAISNLDGSFEIDFGIELDSELERIDDHLEIIVTVSLDNHTFSENQKVVSIKHLGSKSGVSFIDTSTITLTTNIKALGTNCGIPFCLIEISENGVNNPDEHLTDEKGFFSFSALAGTLIKFKPNCFNHSFVQNENGNTSFIEKIVDFNLEERKWDFTDITQYQLDVSVGAGSCNYDLGNFDMFLYPILQPSCTEINIININSTSKTINLPPFEYVVSISNSEEFTTDDDKQNALDYFNLKHITFDLKDNFKSSVLYQPPLQHEFSNLKQYSCEGQNQYSFITLDSQGNISSQVTNNFDPTRTGFFNRGKSEFITLTLWQEFVNLPRCDDTSGQAKITDFASTRTPEIPRENFLTFTQGAFIYYVSPLKASIGNPPERSIDFEISLGEDKFQITPSFKAIVLGTSEIPGTTFLTQTTKIPLMIVRDPPGGNSFARFTKKTATTMKLGMTSQSSSGKTRKGALSFGVNNWEISAFGSKLGKLVFLVGTAFDVNYQMALNENNEVEFTYDFSTSYETSKKISKAGPASDLIIGSGMNFFFGISDVLELDEEICEIISDQTINFQPGELETQFVYSREHIVKNLIPGFRSVIATGEISQEEIVQKTQELQNWENILEYVTDLDKIALAENQEFAFNINNLTYKFEEAWNQAKIDSEIFVKDPVPFLDSFEVVLGLADLLQSSLQAGIPRKTNIFPALESQENIINAGGDLDDIISNFDEFQKEIDSQIISLKTEIIDFVKTLDVSFSGGGSLLETSYGISSSSSSTFKFDINLDATSNLNFNFETMIFKTSGAAVIKAALKLERMSSTKSSESQKVVVGFGDPNPKDSFFIETGFDSVYGTPVFNLKAGESMCPHEENTIPNERPFLKVVGSSSQLDLDPNEPAIFQLSINNLSPTGLSPGSYNLGAVASSNPDGLQLYVNGNPLTGNDIVFNFLEIGQEYNAELVIYKGFRQFDYENIEIELYSACEKAIIVNYLSSKISLDVSWKKPCVFFVWNSQEEQTFKKIIDSSLAEFTNTIDIKIIQNDFELNPLENNDQFVSVTLQYKASNYLEYQDYQTILKQNIDQDLFGRVTFHFNFSSLNDNIYDLRVISKCQNGEIVILNGGQIEINTQTPEIFGFPSPRPGKSYPTNDIFALFNQPLDCSNSESNAKVEMYLKSNPLEKFNAVFICREDQIFISPALPGSYLEMENRIVEVTLSGVEDNIGNQQQLTAKWFFLVEQIENPDQLTVTFSAEFQNTKKRSNSIDIMIQEFATIGEIETSRFSIESTVKSRAQISLSKGPKGSDAIVVLDRISKGLENGELNQTQNLLVKDTFISYNINSCAPGELGCKCFDGLICSENSVCSKDGICSQNEIISTKTTSQVTSNASNFYCIGQLVLCFVIFQVLLI